MELLGALKYPNDIGQLGINPDRGLKTRKGDEVRPALPRLGTGDEH